MKNKTKKAILLLLTLLLTSCVALETKRELIGSDFVSNGPTLKIHFKKKVIDFKENDSKYTFVLAGKKVVKLGFYLGGYSTTTDYYYSLEGFIKSLQDMIYVGPYFFNDHEWAKWAQVKNSYLVTGYFTRKFSDHIQVYTYKKINDNVNSAFKNYKRDLILTDSLKEAIDKEFEKLDELIEIIY